MANINHRYFSEHGHDMPKLYETMIWDIVNKLSRLAVSPSHLDTIHDIVGYATLYEQVLKEE